MNVIDSLIEIFRKFPGVGPRQAERFVYYLLRQEKSELERISSLLPILGEQINKCDKCQRFFLSEHSEDICNICSNKNRDDSVLMIIARDVDLQSIEKSGVYNGGYFVLGGTVPILEKEPEKKIRLRKLLQILEANGEIKEIILALNANPEGENTTETVKKWIKDYTDKNNIKITVLGRGLSTGTELEYSDKETIKNALDGRFS
jgi:recombination protein RecR